MTRSRDGRPRQARVRAPRRCGPSCCCALWYEEIALAKWSRWLQRRNDAAGTEDRTRAVVHEMSPQTSKQNIGAENFHVVGRACRLAPIPDQKRCRAPGLSAGATAR